MLERFWLFPAQQLQCGTARKFTALIPSLGTWPKCPLYCHLQGNTHTIWMFQLKKQSASENSVSLYQHDEVRVKCGTKIIWAHTGRIQQRNINEVNWGFSKSTLFVVFFFLFVCLFLFQSQNQPKRKEDEIVFLSSIKKSSDCAGSEWGEPFLSPHSWQFLGCCKGEVINRLLLYFQSWSPEISLTGSRHSPDF